MFPRLSPYVRIHVSNYRKTMENIISNIICLSGCKVVKCIIMFRWYLILRTTSTLKVPITSVNALKFIMIQLFLIWILYIAFNPSYYEHNQSTNHICQCSKIYYDTIIRNLNPIYSFLIIRTPLQYNRDTFEYK